MILTVKEFLEEVIDKMVLSKNNNPTQVVLATYYRVGDGSLDGKLEIPGIHLHIFSGSISIEIPTGQYIVDGVLEKIKELLENKLIYMFSPPLIVIYGGDVENFNKVGALIEEIDQLCFMLNLIKQEQRPKIFLLTCPCAREEKITAVSKMIETGKLSGLISDPMPADPDQRACGGLWDMAAIAKRLGFREKQKTQETEENEIRWII